MNDKNKNETKGDELSELESLRRRLSDAESAAAVAEKARAEAEAKSQADAQARAEAEEALRLASSDGSGGKRDFSDLSTTTTKPTSVFVVKCVGRDDLGEQQFKVVDESEAIRLFTIKNKLDVSSHSFRVKCLDPEREKRVARALEAGQPKPIAQ